MEYAGKQWLYRFREVPATFDEESVKKAISSLTKRYRKALNKPSGELNSEWVCRCYLSAKLIMAATLTTNASLFSEDRNLRVVIPYLRYYTLLSICRSIVLMVPEHQWNQGQLFQVSHNKAIEIATSHIRLFSVYAGNDAEQELQAYKAERELISYRAPSSGDRTILPKPTFLSLCMLMSEVAQLSSELLTSVAAERLDESHKLVLEDDLYRLANIEIGEVVFSDSEDAMRLDYLRRKAPSIAPLRTMMKEGHVDDFFGAWHGTDEVEDGSFDPDERQTVIFDIP